ncbi:MAG TPA: prepilin-type N-terminal cleavage/methylation domain-containing protein [Chthoniobacteraceae bacterium]|nr:prepilin-type N-terminal cleavage/methylation domain-containing protein [Chthoniobacteraceae bacterium]
MNRPKQKGFTLTEMLIVVGVLLVLGLLGFPVIVAQAEKGRTAACVVKLRNLAVIMTQFRTERSQRMWNLKAVADGGEGGAPPVVTFYRYGLIRSASAMCCPSAVDPSAANPERKAWITGGTGSPDFVRNIASEPLSYAVNGQAFYQYSAYRNSSVTVASFHYYNGHEGKLPLFMDGKVFQLNQTSWQPPMRFTRLALRHQDRCNVLFMDGHVESLDRRGAERLDPHGGTSPAWLKDYGVAD